jgi:hypothetical protein
MLRIQREVMRAQPLFAVALTRTTVVRAGVRQWCDDRLGTLGQPSYPRTPFALVLNLAPVLGPHEQLELAIGA